MRSLGTWLLVIAGIGAGTAFLSTSAHTPALVVAALGFAFVALAGSAWPSRGAWPIFCALVVALAFARAVSHGQAQTLAPTADRRGPASATREVEILSASTPGPRCHVRARTSRGDDVDLSLPAGACPLWRGQSVRVLSEDLHTDAGRASPDGSSRVFVSRSWPASAGSTGVASLGSEALARARQVGWTQARGDPSRGFVVASSLGLPAALPPEARARLQRAGLGHLIAVSGLHVGLAAWAWLACLRWLLARWWWGPRVAVLASALPVVAYVVLTGAAAPAVRAAVMFGLLGLGTALGRPLHAPSVLVVAAALMLFVRPTWLLQPGFQLSMAAMIVLVGLEGSRGAAFTSWHLGWALLPLLWLHFDAASDGSVLANAIAVPVFTLWVVPAAVVGWGLLPLVGAAALAPAAAGGAVILEVAEAVASFPEVPRGVWVGVAAVSMLPWVRRGVSDRVRAWLPHRGAACLLLAVAVASSRSPQPRPGWTAWSGGRQPEVLGVSEHGAGCVRAPSTSVSRWRGRLADAGVHVLAGIQTSARRSTDDPALVAWRQALSPPSLARGVPPCTLPARDDVRQALERCSAYAPKPTARKPEGLPLQCWSARLGAWRPASIQSPWRVS